MAPETATGALLLGAAYLLGSIPFGVLIARWKAGVDPRSGGSGNIGATNVARVAGKKLGIVTLLLDAAKGAAAVLLAWWLFPAQPWAHAAAAATAFLGHVFPVWLRFRGGKGVATALGVLLLLVPIPALAGAVAYAAIVGSVRVSSVGSLVGGVVAVVTSWVLGAPLPYAVLATALFAAMLLTHRGNIRRLLRRAERRF